MILKTKLALVTGTNRGVGLSVLKKFSENGADVIACGRSKNEKFEQLILDISKKCKNKITPVYFDLSNENEIEQGIEKIQAISNKIEIIVNNAGINQVSLFQMTSIEKIKEIFYEIVSKGIAILFVEQNVKLALNMADRGYVLESGHLVIEGKSDYLLNSEKLKRVFLG